MAPRIQTTSQSSGFAGSIDEDTSAWAIDMNNLGQSAHQVNGYAICAA